MAWEERTRGGRYYVRKRWQGGRCISEYIGGGATAVAVANRDERERRRRHADRLAWREERRRAQGLDAGQDEVTEIAATLTTALLLVAGCRTHRGQWRRRRE